MAETIKEQSSKQMYIEDMVKYAVFVDRARAFAEIKDGLKPVQRKVIYTMYELGLGSKFRKSAKVTGDVMGNYHPHANSYGTLMPMLNWWKCKLPLIIGSGNLGTVMGDGPAAERYTEVKLSPFCMDCVIGEMQDAGYVVDWKENYDRTRKEPEFFPVKVPLLMINGSFGIGVGMENCTIPPHNPIEVLEATRRLLWDPNYEPVLVPDHCQPLKIFNADWESISRNGYGKYKVRGIVQRGMDKDYPYLEILSLPDNVRSYDVTDKLYKMVADKQLPMIHDIQDNSKETIDIKIVLKKGSDPGYVEEVLYNKCRVQDNITVNFQAVDDITPKRFSYKAYLTRFIQFRETTKFRLYCNLYQAARTKHHKYQTYIELIESGKIIEVSKLVMKQKTRDSDTLKELLIKKFGLTDIQAEYILATNIRSLSLGNLEYFKSEFAKIEQVLPKYRAAITDDGNIIKSEIDAELLEIEKKYGTQRICCVVDESLENNIPKGTFKIVVTEKNFIRKLQENDKVVSVRGDDPKFVAVMDNTDNIIFFDNRGRAFKLPVHKLPLMDKSNGGVDVRILLKNLTANIISMVPESVIENIVNSKGKMAKHFLIVCTKDNMIKKLELEDFLNVNSSGLMYTKLKDDDTVVAVTIQSQQLDVVIYSEQKALRTSVSEIPLFKRNSAGSKAMDTESPLEGVCDLYPEDDTVIVVTRNGKINAFMSSFLGTYKRGRKGVNVIKLDKNDSIKAIVSGTAGRTLYVWTTEKLYTIPIADLALKSPVATGQKAIPDLKGSVVKVYVS